jgi:hypothetical protein
MLQVPLSDVWLSTCISEVSEVTLDPETSFVIGWPINNAVITFGLVNFATGLVSLAIGLVSLAIGLLILAIELVSLAIGLVSLVIGVS